MKGGRYFHPQICHFDRRIISLAFKKQQKPKGHSDIPFSYWKQEIKLMWELHSQYLCRVLSYVWLFTAPWTVAHQSPLPMGFSRQEYWSGLPFPTPENLPDPGIELMSLASPALAGRFFTTKAIWEGQYPNKREIFLWSLLYTGIWDQKNSIERDLIEIMFPLLSML